MELFRSENQTCTSGNIRYCFPTCRIGPSHMPLSKSSMVLLRPALESAVDIHPSRLELPWFRAYPFYRSQKDEFTLADSLAVVEAQHNRSEEMRLRKKC